MRWSRTTRACRTATMRETGRQAEGAGWETSSGEGKMARPTLDERMTREMFGHRRRVKIQC